MINIQISPSLIILRIILKSMYTCLKIDKNPLHTYSHMKRRIDPGKSWYRRKCKYFRMHIRKYNRAFGRDVCHKGAYHESWHYRVSKQTRSRGATFFSLFPSPSFFSSCDTLLHGERMYAKTIFWMYNERCANGEWGTDRRSKRLRLVNSAEVPFPYFAFAQHGHLQQQFFVSGPTRGIACV